MALPSLVITIPPMGSKSICKPKRNNFYIELLHGWCFWAGIAAKVLTFIIALGPKHVRIMSAIV